MDVAYNYFGNFTGTHRIWALDRVPLNLLAGITPDDEVTATVQCDGDKCSTVRVAKPSAAPSSALEISGRYHGWQEKEALLILQPFPFEPSPALFSQLDYEPGITKIIEVQYRRENNKLVFQRLQLVGIQKREAVVWK